MKDHELFAYLHVTNAAKAIEFYGDAFRAKKNFSPTEPSGRIGHAELDFDGTTLMLADEFPEYGIVGPQTIGGTSVSIHLHVDNADEMIQRAVNAGRRSRWSLRTSSMANVPGASATPSAIAGTSDIASRRSPRPRCSGDIPRC